MALPAKAQASAFYLPKDELLRRPEEWGVAIDPVDPAEIDDAVSVDWNEDGSYRVAIHVSDAGILMNATSVIQAARDKGWTRYSDPGGAQTTDLMIPADISLKQIGLDSNHFGLGAPAVTVAFSFDPVLRRVGNLDIFKSRVVCDQISYTDFHRRLRNNNQRASRIKAAAMQINQDIDTPSDFYGLGAAKDTVGELMVAANRLIADEMRKHGIPWLYRNHNQRVPSNLRDFDVSSIDQTIDDLLDTMGRARYSSIPSRHEGLNLMPYCHFTSPLRRFADLVNHLTLHALLSGKPLPYNQAELEVIADELTMKTAHELGILTLRAAS